MKRPRLFLFALCSAAALAGWALAYHQHRSRVNSAATATAAAKAAAARKQGEYLAGLVRQGDEVVIVFRDHDRESEVRNSDPEWLARLAVILEEATFEDDQGHALMISFPYIRIYQQQTQSLLIMPLFRERLRVYSEKCSGDFMISPHTSNAISLLAQEKKPTEP
jgi:hypothetical protein